MAAAIGQHVLGRDREKSPEREWPQNVRLRLDQERQTDPCDVRARHIGDSTPEPPGEENLRRDRDAKRRREPLVAAEDAVARLAHHEHQRDEKDDQVFGIGEDALQRGGSVMTCSWSIVRPFTTCSVPDGQRIVTRLRRCAPSPKCRRRSFWLQNPEPPSTTC